MRAKQARAISTPTYARANKGQEGAHPHAIVAARSRMNVEGCAPSVSSICKFVVIAAYIPYSLEKSAFLSGAFHGRYASYRLTAKSPCTGACEAMEVRRSTVFVATPI